MKSNIIKSIITTLVVIITFQNVFSQEKKIYKGEIPAPVKTEESVLREQQNQPPVSGEVVEFQNRMNAARESGNREEMLRLQSESDRVLGTYTEALHKSDAKTAVFPIEAEEDNIVTHSITNDNNETILGIATCTEQSGNNTGRIWSVNSFYYAPPSDVNGIMVKYSDDDGLTWTNFGSYGFTDYIENDLQLDAELIINSSNDKYLWIVYKEDVNYTNKIRAGLLILHLNRNDFFDFSHSYLDWPGGNNVYYKTPRIVSDNSQYPDLALMYIAASIDSSSSNDPYSGPGVFGEKVAVCYNPYTTSPLISYRARPFMRTLTGYIHNPSLEHFNCDIAYYRNGGQDSVLLIETGLETASSIALGRTGVISFLTGNSYLVYQGTINVNSNKRTRGFIASNGAYNNLMISVNYEYSASDHDIEYYRSTNGSENWLRGFIDDYTSDATGDADITGQRNTPGKFAVAFNTNYPSGLNYYQSGSYIWSSVSSNNFSHLKSQWSNPKAGIRINSGSDNCFAIWADTTRHGIWSSAGCNGPAVSYAKLKIASAIEGLYIPEEIVIPDTVRVYLRNSTAPYVIADSSKGVLNNYYTSNFIFSNAPYNTPLYVQIKHRNALETWSSGTITITAYENFYNFLIQSNTLGNNTKQIDSLNYFGKIYGFYSGDVNQDGYIDLTDVLTIYNGANNFLSGYVVTDLNGDSIVDLTDLLIAYNNSVNFVSVVRP